ncbi:MAG: hypothetical protein A2252_03900 [Elusimicrobia bacterium RIFOXYA2_FULL_39_19]|nr:MAG: hypothetical protein A2252_03900 [Elusimicrobia bacterium RIFOXYA2_FULL_39_19]
MQMETITNIEYVILAFISAIAIYEFLGLMIARRKKLTTNVSRLVTHAGIFCFAVLFAIYSAQWLAYFSTINQEKLNDVRIFNWQFIAIIIAMGFSMIWEFIGIYEARRAGKTKNIARFVSHGILIIFFSFLFYTSILKWNVYVKALTEPSMNKMSTSVLVPVTPAQTPATVSTKPAKKASAKSANTKKK